MSATASPWHDGERRLRAGLGVAERLEEIGHRVIRDELIPQHRAFYPMLSFVVLGTVDAAGDAWATLRAGHPGFLSAPDPHQLAVAVGRDPADPADAGMEDGAGIGLLGIDLSNRRRNRLNGTILRDSADSFAIAVAQSYGNCPRYIQLRRFAFTREPADPSPIAPVEIQAADPRVASMVGGADTFFVATYVTDDGGRHAVDVSHRGGKPGFVRLGGDGALTVPDFAGNLFFNTLGNILVNPKTGLVFVDFETGDLLQMTGDAELILDSPEIAAFEGAERLWRFRPRRIVYRAQGLPLRWETPADGASPFALETGSWGEAAARLAGRPPMVQHSASQEIRP